MTFASHVSENLKELHRVSLILAKVKEDFRRLGAKEVAEGLGDLESRLDEVVAPLTRYVKTNAEET